MQQNGRRSLRAKQAARREQGYQALSNLFTKGPMVVPNPRYVPPYESAYRGRYAPGAAHQGLLRGAHSSGSIGGVSDGLQAEHFYAESGWEAPEEWAACPDHIGVELQFMAHLCALEADACRDRTVRAAESWRGWQRAFLRIHLGGWVPEFCARLAQAAEHPFYVVVAAATLHRVRSDLEGLG